jgi:hypothetical protein
MRDSGSITRPIGRLESEAIADQRRGNRMAGDQTHQQPGRCAGVTHVQGRAWLQQTAYTHAPHTPDAGCIPFDDGPHSAHRCGGGEHILAFQQPFYATFADCQAREHQRAVADRFVPWDGHRAAQRPARGNGIWNGKGGDHRRGFDSGLALWQGARHFNGDISLRHPGKFEQKGKSGTW